MPSFPTVQPHTCIDPIRRGSRPVIVNLCDNISSKFPVGSSELGVIWIKLPPT